MSGGGGGGGPMYPPEPLFYLLYTLYVPLLTRLPDYSDLDLQHTDLTAAAQRTRRGYGTGA